MAKLNRRYILLDSQRKWLQKLKDDKHDMYHMAQYTVDSVLDKGEYTEIMRVVLNNLLALSKKHAKYYK